MKQENLTLIDKRLVHKKSYDNVLIYNLRREIPHFLSISEFDCIMQNIDSEKQTIIMSNYIHVITNESGFLHKQLHEYYMLKSIVPEISGNLVDKLADTLDIQDQAFLLLLYEPVAGQDKLRLFRDISEEEEKHVLKILELKAVEIDDRVKCKLSQIIEEVGLVQKSDIFYANMYVNLDHDFFFEHFTDHVPGFMLIEAFRQFCVAVNHTFGNVPLSDSQLVLECLNSNFYKYAELSLPVRFKGFIKEVKLNRKGEWSYLDFESEVIQNNNEVAKLRIYGNIISKGLFKRIRKNEIEKNLKLFRYKISDTVNTNFELLDNSVGIYVDSEIVNLSMSGFMIKSEHFISDQSGDNYDFMFYIKQIGFIKGVCKKVWVDEITKTAGMRICDMDVENFKRLKDMIARYCYVYARNEII